MVQTASRRTVLRSIPLVSVALFAGCSSITSSLTGPPPDVVVFNRTSASIKTSITVTNRSNGNTALSDTATIKSNKASEYPKALPASGDFAATVMTNGGLSGNYKWTVSSEDQSLQVRVNDNSTKFGTVSP